MAKSISVPAAVCLGVVPTHLRFVGGLVPDAAGRYLRDQDGVIRVVRGMRELVEASPVALDAVQVSLFPGCDREDLDEMIGQLRELGLAVDLILMLGEVDPKEPAAEDAVVEQLRPSIELAMHHQIQTISSTSIDVWMGPVGSGLSCEARAAAIAQNARVHSRLVRETGALESSVRSWHIEFLRPGEFQTFTNIEHGRAVVQAANAELGCQFFKLIVDAAHCGDSGLSLERNAAVIRELGAAGELGAFHASSPTTRGCLTTDDGWVGVLLAAAAATGQLEKVYLEIFDHQDEALQALRDLGVGFGVDTRDGRSYTQTAADGLGELARRLNHLQRRGFFQA